MIKGIGIDIVENNRIQQSLCPQWIDMVLTSNEKQIYTQKKGKKQLEFLCGRFACKEAIIKAISQYENPHFQEIEIINKENGQPVAIFKNYHILISISHEVHYTIAQAILIQ